MTNFLSFIIYNGLVARMLRNGKETYYYREYFGNRRHNGGK